MRHVQVRTGWVSRVVGWLTAFAWILTEETGGFICLKVWSSHQQNIISRLREVRHNVCLGTPGLVIHNLGRLP